MLQWILDKFFFYLKIRTIVPYGLIIKIIRLQFATGIKVVVLLLLLWYEFNNQELRIVFDRAIHVYIITSRKGKERKLHINDMSVSIEVKMCRQRLKRTYPVDWGAKYYYKYSTKIQLLGMYSTKPAICKGILVPMFPCFVQDNNNNNNNRVQVIYVYLKRG